MTKSVNVFCGAEDKLPVAYKQLAFALGARLAENNITLVTGGGNTGLMKELNDGHASVALDMPRYGIIPDVFAGMGGEHEQIPKENLFWIKGKPNRLKDTHAIYDDIIVLPGGFGTLYEVMDSLVHNQAGLFRKNIYLVNIDNFWQHLLELFTTMLDKSAISTEHRALLIEVENLDELFAHLL